MKFVRWNKDVSVDDISADHLIIHAVVFEKRTTIITCSCLSFSLT